MKICRKTKKEFLKLLTSIEKYLKDSLLKLLTSMTKAKNMTSRHWINTPQTKKDKSFTNFSNSTNLPLKLSKMEYTIWKTHCWMKILTPEKKKCLLNYLLLPTTTWLYLLKIIQKINKSCSLIWKYLPDNLNLTLDKLNLYVKSIKTTNSFC